MKQMRHLLLCCLLVTAFGTLPTTAFESHEWFITVHDPGITKPQKVHLPRFIRTRRTRAVGDGPPPPARRNYNGRTVA